MLSEGFAEVQSLKPAQNLFADSITQVKHRKN